MQTRIPLLVIAISLSSMHCTGTKLRRASLRSGQAYPLFVEPGTTKLRAPDGSRQVLAKVVIDLRNGISGAFHLVAGLGLVSAASGHEHD